MKITTGVLFLSLAIFLNYIGKYNIILYIYKFRSQKYSRLKYVVFQKQNAKKSLLIFKVCTKNRPYSFIIFCIGNEKN